MLHRRKLSDKSKHFVKQQCAKPVVVHEQNNGTGSIVNVNDVCNRDNLEHCLSSYRSSVRKSVRLSHVRRCSERESSEYLSKKLSAMRKRKNRQIIKHILRTSTLKSSILNELANNYKEYYLKFVPRYNFFTQSFGHLSHSVKVQNKIHTAGYSDLSYLANSQSIINANCNFANEDYCVSGKKALKVW